MADWSTPTLSSTYTNFLTNLKDRDTDNATQFSVGTPTNVPTGAVKWDSTANRWKQWSGTAWAELTVAYDFNNAKIGGYQIIHANNYNTYAPTLTGTGASGTWAINISGNAATATSATTATTATTATSATTATTATSATTATTATNLSGGTISTGTGSQTFNGDVVVASGKRVFSGGAVLLPGTGATIAALTGLGAVGSYPWHGWYNTSNTAGLKYARTVFDNSGSINVEKLDDTYTTATTLFGVTTAGVFRFNSGFGSVAQAYGCRAWVNFNGTGTVAIRASGNVSSITDNGVGDYTVNFTSAMPDVNYSVAGSNESATGDTNGPVVTVNYANTTTSARIWTVGAYNNNTNRDCTTISVSVFR